MYLVTTALKIRKCKSFLTCIFSNKLNAYCALKIFSMIEVSVFKSNVSVVNSQVYSPLHLITLDSMLH